MKLSREAIQRMISQKPGTSNVTVINQEGGGGVTLGPLLTSLNAEAMPTAEGYLHWTGSDWDFTSIDLSSYATEAWVTSQLNNLGDSLQSWVLQQGYVTSSAISDMATETWVLQQGYVTSSAVSDMATETWVQQQGYITASAVSAGWKVKDVEVVDDNSVIINGEEVIYGASFTTDGMLTLGRARLSIYEPEYTSDLINDSGFINQYTADGRYLQLTAGGSNPLTGSLFWNVANQTENLIISNNKIQLSVSGTPHNIVLFEGSTASLTSYAKFYERPMVKTGTNNGTPVYTNVALVSEVEAKQDTIHFFNTKASNTEVFFSNIYLPLNYQGGGTVYLDLSDYVTALGVSGDNLTYTKNGVSTPITVPFATSTMGFKRLSVTGSQTADANTMTVGDVEYALLSNYASINLWSNMPSGMSYGSVLWLASATSLHGQLAWDSNHGVTTGVTRKLYWRSRNSNGWGTNDWHTIAFEDWVTSQLNTLGDNLQSYVTTQLGGYLPLTAGSSKPLTGGLYINNAEGLTINAQVSTDSTKWHNMSMFWRGDIFNIYAYETRYWDICLGCNSSYVSNYGGLYYDSTNYRWGIGTTTPAYKLDVNGHISGSNIYAGNYLFMNKGAGGIYLATDHIAWHDSSHTYIASLLNFTSAGNVGIGGIDPQAKLHVNGNVRISGTLTGVTNIDGLMIFDSTNNKVTVGTLDVSTLGMTSISVGENGYKMSVTSDDYGVTFNGATDGDYIFMWNSTTRGNIYAGSGDFSGNLTAGSRPSDADQKLYVGGSAVITGYVGIGTRPTGTYTVDVDGTIYASSSVHASSFVNNSDIRMKDVTRFIEPSVHDIAIAPIIEFAWKKGDGSKNIGSIAQYWQTVFPQAVHDGGDGLLSMEYGNIALASAITAARHSLDNERRIAELELRVAELEDELAAMVSQQSETTEN